MGPNPAGSPMAPSPMVFPEGAGLFPEPITALVLVLFSKISLSFSAVHTADAAVSCYRKGTFDVFLLCTMPPCTERHPSVTVLGAAARGCCRGSGGRSVTEL